MHGNAVVLDLREDEVIHPTNRSITNRSSRTNVGALMLSYGGGGHDAAGTCQIANDQAGRVLAELLERVTADG